MRSSSPHPSVLQTSSGLLITATLLSTTGLYIFQPALRPIIDASCGGLILMIPAALGGTALRVGADMQRGKPHLNTYALRYSLAGLALVMLAITLALRASGQPSDVAGLAGAVLPLLHLAVAGLVGLAAWAGYDDGDDETWRQRQARLHSGVPLR